MTILKTTLVLAAMTTSPLVAQSEDDYRTDLIRAIASMGFPCESVTSNPSLTDDPSVFLVRCNLEGGGEAQYFFNISEGVTQPITQVPPTQ